MGLTLLDSSVWIDLLRDRPTPQVARARQLLDAGSELGVGDLMVVEVLQGTGSVRQFSIASDFLDSFVPIAIADHLVARSAALHYRTLRERGITIRKTIDTLIATRCILDRLPLLYSDRDFDPFVQHLGLRSAMDYPTGVN